MFWAATQLYGFGFAKVDDVAVFDPAMSVYEVKDRDGAHLALWYFDPPTPGRSRRRAPGWNSTGRSRRWMGRSPPSSPTTPIS